MKKEKYDVLGMTCASCQAHVNKAVSELDGVKSCSVNLVLNNMYVEYDDKKLDENKIIKAVQNAGYDARVQNEEIKKDINKINDEEEKKLKRRLVLSIIFWIPLMFIAMHKMIFDMLKIGENPISNIFDDGMIFAISQILLLIPIVILNFNYYKSGFKSLLKRAPNMDALVAIGSMASIVYSLFATYKIYYASITNNMEMHHEYMHNLYFESAGTILTLITVGKYLESRSKRKTTNAISKLINLAPKTAIILKGNEEVEIESSLISTGDVLLIKPGSNIPVDGEIIEGSSAIDQSSITGESVPVEKEIGDTVISGTTNKTGAFKMKATKVGDDTTLSQIVKLVEEASNSKAPISRLADSISRVFVPIVILIAVIVTIIWIVAGYSFVFALEIGIAVLVISCPCALGLATPLAIMVGTGKGAENGILIKSAESLEGLHNVDTVVFDKTGTVTEGKPEVTDILTNLDIIQDSFSKNSNIKFVGNISNVEDTKRTFLAYAASIEKNSEHPFALAILEKAKEEKIELFETNNFEAVSGRGIKASIDKMNFISGNASFMQENNINIKDFDKKAEELLSEGKTILYFAKDKRLTGIIAVKDTIKKSTYLAIEELKRRNLDVRLLTGDNEVVAKSIGKTLNIDNVISEVMPQEKEKEIEKLQNEGKKVLFVGDGINDSPSLVKADIGIAIGSGTDIAIDSADIVLINNKLTDVVNAIDLSKATISNIKLSLFWAFIYNIIGIPIAAGMLFIPFGIKLSPMLGAACMSLSSFCVCLNALRLTRFKPIKLSNEILNEENRKQNNRKEIIGMKEISIEGMMCEHCKMHVEKALSAIEGVEKVEVSLENKNAKIETSKEIDNETIEKAVKEAGYTVKDIK